jgi:hypothetical protein
LRPALPDICCGGRASCRPLSPAGRPLPRSPRSGKDGGLWAGLTLLGAVAAFAAAT